MSKSAQKSLENLRITVLDIPDSGHGVGLAIVLRTPHGKTILYDTGVGYPEGDGWSAGINSGRDQILPFLQQHGIDKIDTLIISHSHYDHFGGLLWLADQIPVGELIDNGYEFNGRIDDHYTRELAAYANIRDKLLQTGTSYRVVHAGDTLNLDPELTVRVIAPPADFFHEPEPEKRPENDPAAHYMLNANSIMLHIRHGKVTILFGGDIEKEDQSRYLLPSVSPAELDCDILIAPGHGLHTAEDFADATSPEAVVASCFSRWAGGCTARGVFAARGAKVYVTGLDGDVDICSNSHEWQIHCRK